MPDSDDSRLPRNPYKGRTGFNHLWYATGYSVQGLRAALQEAAFRQQLGVAVVLVPAAFWLGRDWVEVALLAGSVLLIMIVELLNTGIEAAVDRIGPETHPLSKRAKDTGSAAVMLAMMLAGAIWLGALYTRFLQP